MCEGWTDWRRRDRRKAQRSLVLHRTAPAPGRVRGWNGLLAAAGGDDISGRPKGKVKTSQELVYISVCKCACTYGVCVRGSECVCTRMHIIPCATPSVLQRVICVSVWSGDAVLRSGLLSRLHWSEHTATGCHERGGEGKDRQMRRHETFSQHKLFLFASVLSFVRIWRTTCAHTNITGRFRQWVQRPEQRSP